MKLIRKLKRTVGKLLFAILAFNSISPILVARERSIEHDCVPADYIYLQDANLEKLVTEIVHKAAAMDMTNLMPSAALMRCYERMAQGFKTVLVEDVMEAMPELLGHALAQYQATHRAPRPQNPYAPGAVVGSILADPSINCVDADANISEELCQIINLLLIIKKKIGTVEDDVCCDSVLGVLGDACEILGVNISIFLLDIMNTLTACCASLHCEIRHLECEIDHLRSDVDCKLGDFNDCCDCNDIGSCLCEPCDVLGTRAVVCEACTTASTDCCPVFDNVSQGLSEIYCEIQTCCEQTQSNFEFTWSLIEECCQSTQSLIEECCLETQSLIEECCEQTQSNFEFTWWLIEECCESTQSLIEACCEQTQSNFEYTWSLIEACCEQTQSNFEITWSLLEECCEQTQSNFEITWSLIEECCQATQSAIDDCCRQTQSNFEYTWSLIEDCCQSTQSAIEDCCRQTQSNFEITWSLIEECCEQTQSNFEFTWSLIEDCCQSTQSAIEDCCRQTQSNFEFTWSLIEDCCQATQSAIEDCCLQTQSNFEFTWSLIEDCCQATQSLIEDCCEQTQSNFEFTWSLIEDCCQSTQSLIQDCCEQTQSNFEFTWSLIEDCCQSTQSAIDDCCRQTQSNFEVTWSLIEECCEQTQSNFEITWSLIEECCQATQSAIEACCEQTLSLLDANYECCLNNCDKLECIKELLQDTTNVAHRVTEPLTITEAGTYVLVNNIIGNIFINTSNVTLDLNGFNIVNNTGDAITIANVADITIHNGFVSASEVGININATAADILVTGVDFQGCTLGVRAVEAYGVRLSNALFYNGTQALDLNKVVGCTIENCQFIKHLSVAGDPIIYLNGCSSMVIENNIIGNNFVVASGSAVLVSGCYALQWNNNLVNENRSDNTMTAMRIELSSVVSVRNSQYVDNLSLLGNAYGLMVFNSNTGTIENSISSQNFTQDPSASGYGFYLDSVFGYSLVNSTAAQNRSTATSTGIAVVTSFNSSIANNTLLQNTIGFAKDTSSVGVLKNYAEGNVTNYVGTVPVVVFNKALGSFMPANPTSFDNVSAI